MFKCQIKYETLKEIVDITRVITKSIRITFATDGINITSADGAHISLVSLKYNDKVFSSFVGDPADIVVDLDRLHDTLGFGKAGQICTIEYLNNGDRKERIAVSMTNVVKTMALLSLEEFGEFPKIPNITLPCYVVMKLSEFDTAVAAGGTVSDEIAIDFMPEGIKTHSQSSLDTVDVRISKEKFSKFEIKEKMTSSFALKMLKNFCNALKGVEQIVLYGGQDAPIRIDADLSGGVGKVKFLLAPKSPEVAG
jgi:proliferating cell nuclear antigen